MKKFLLLLISFFVGMGLFLWTGRTVGWREIQDSLGAVRGWEGLMVLGLTVLISVFGALRWKAILRGQGSAVSFSRILGPYLAGFSLMFLAPALLWGGEMFKAYALKGGEESGVQDISFSKSMASVIIDRIMDLGINLAVIFFGVLVFLSQIGFSPLKTAVILTAVLCSFLAVVAIFSIKCVKKESFVKMFLGNGDKNPLEIEKEIFSFFGLRNISMWKAVLLSVLKAGTAYLRAWILILFLGLKIGIASSAVKALAVSGFTYLALFFPIPAALGSHEAIQAFAFNSLGLEPSKAAAFAMILRGAEFVLVFIGIIFFFRLGIIILKNALLKKVEALTGGAAFRKNN